MTPRYHGRALFVPLLVSLAIQLTTFAEVLHGQTEASEDIPYDSVEQRRLHIRMLEERDGVTGAKKILQAKEQELQALRAEVEKKLEELDAKLAEVLAEQAELRRLLDRKAAREADRLKSLAQVYARMTPAKAAVTLAQLERDLAADLLAAMQARAAARILERMDRRLAAELSSAYTTLENDDS